MCGEEEAQLPLLFKYMVRLFGISGCGGGGQSIVRVHSRGGRG